MLSQLLASMKDGEGRVTVASFEDDVVPLTAAERIAIAAVPSAEAALSADLGLARAEGGGEPMAALINRPSLNIDGIRSADVGSAARNVIPSIAMATLDMRLVKGNDPVRQVGKLKAHAERQGYLVLDREPTMAERREAPRIATLVLREGYAAARTALDHPLATRMITGMKAAGPVVVMPTMGGSLPLSVVQDTLDVPTVTMALWNHDNNQHGEDENLRLGHFWQGIAAVAQVMVTK
jgi:acetylornithine deacetylase/succinyl-diaminopimelate desuccinylase-like protein